MSGGTISVRVDTPTQRKGNGALELPYYVYPVTLSLLGVAGERHFSRRYSDFESLRCQLSANSWSSIVPPLPEKDSVQGTLQKIALTSRETERGHLEYRRSALRRFLLRVAHHPVLGKEPLLEKFTDDNLWSQCVRDPVKPPKYVTLSISGSLSKAWSSSQHLDGSLAYSRALQADSLDLQTLEATRGYVKQMEGSIRTMKEKIQGMIGYRRDTAVAMFDFGEAAAKVGNGEDDEALRTALDTVSQHSKRLSQLHVDQCERETAQIVNTLSYYVGMCVAVREAAQRMHCATHFHDNLCRRVQELEASLAAAPFDRQGQLQVDLAMTAEHKHMLEQQLNEARKNFKTEMNRFHRDKQYDMRELLKVFGELQISYSGGLAKEWESLRPLVDGIMA